MSHATNVKRPGDNFRGAFHSEICGIRTPHDLVHRSECVKPHRMR